MSQILAPFQLLELNVISAQDLAPVGRNMRTYAVAWVHPDRKLSTRVDTQGHTNPTWNDKFVFRVDEEFLYADTSAIMIEIYALHWFRDIHVGTVRVLVGNLIPPPARPFHNNRAPLGMRFVALQVRRASGRPQGILNIGVAVLDSSMRSMPLYTLNSSAVGYRHLMGEKDAYETHNHLSPHVFQSSKPELRRTKSDTSSMIASEVAARHQRTIINKGKPSSVISGSEMSVKKYKKNKRRKKKTTSSKASSIVSGVSAKSDDKVTGSVLSDSVLPWNFTNQRKIATASDVHVEEPPPQLPHDHENHHHNEVVEIENDNKEDSLINTNTVSEAASSDINTKEGTVPITNIAYEVSASPRQQFRNSPAVAPQFHSSPAPAQFMKSPKAQFINSPKPQFKKSPMPEYRNSPMPEFRNSPMPEFRNSPMPEFKNSPMPQFRNSPMPEFRNSPKPQFKNSPMPEIRNSPKPEFRNSPKPQFRNSPVVGPQVRSSPMVTKFNPAVGFGGGSHRGTPIHQFGKLNGAFEYATPRRVAADMARKPVIEEGENSTVGGWSLDESIEGLQSKLERWRTELPPVIDRGEFSSFPTSSTKTTSRHTRRHTDGGSGSGLFSCFSNICGIECSIVCGGDSKAKKNRNRRRTPSDDNTSLL
ncbi:C2 domain [Sesbania bispinosa]|nr:C2 domain [Sesbania bispinosa]